MERRQRETERQRDRETERQRHGETERPRDRDTERQREIDRERESLSLSLSVCLCLGNTHEFAREGGFSPSPSALLRRRVLPWPSLLLTTCLPPPRTSHFSPLCTSKQPRKRDKRVYVSVCACVRVCVCVSLSLSTHLAFSCPYLRKQMSPIWFQSLSCVVSPSFAQIHTSERASEKTLD